MESENMPKSKIAYLIQNGVKKTSSLETENGLKSKTT